MLNLNSRQATICAIIIFVITLALGYYFPGKPIVTCGLLIAIFLTIFIRYVYSTIVAGAISIAIAVVYPVIHHQQTGSFTGLSENLFIILLLFFSTLLAWYIKSLLLHLQFDRTHMTSLFENATEGILLTDGAGMIVLANPSAKHIFGYSDDELTGLPIEALIPRKFHDHHRELRAGFYKNPSNRTMGSGRDLYAVKKNGIEFPVEVSLSHYQQDEEKYVIAFVVDITLRKEVEKSIYQKQRELEIITVEIQQLNTQLEAKVEERTSILKEALQNLEQSQAELSEALTKEKQLNELKTRFVSMASHEFRTPLTTILSSATLISKYPLTEDDDKRGKHIGRIRDAVDHMNELLEDFLSLGRLEENKMEVNPGEFIPGEFLEDVVEELRTLSKPGQQIDFSYTGSGSFYTDKRLVKNVLINLLSNAIKFSAPDQRIDVNVTKQDGQLILEVRDYGIGISEADIPELFTTFFRGKNASNIQGTGLGLPIIKRYLKLINGSVNVKSKLNEGTTFTVVVPVMQRSFNGS